MTTPKDNFNEASIRDRADILKCATAIRVVLNQELVNPSEEFVRLVFGKMDCGGNRFTPQVKEKLTPLVKSELESVINDKVKAHLNNALNTTQAKAESIAASTAAVDVDENDGILTTQEEIDAHNIIRAILCAVVPVEEVAMRDAKSYCAILYQNNNRKPLCRLYFNGAKKSIGLFDGDTEEKMPVEQINDIYKYADRLKNALNKYVVPAENANYTHFG